MKYDIIVIGSGPGGYVAAIRAAQLGKKVAVVERAEAGGVCLNWGCIPTKALLKSAQVYNYCKSAEHYGLDFAGEVRPNLEKIVARSRGVAETMNKGVLFLLKKNNVELINGFAKLKGNGRIDVDGTEYEADHIILATGARPREMPFMPIDGEHVISSKQALVLPKLPETMIVVGSGAIGSEFAYFYAALGVKVTIVEYLPQIMPLEDEEVAKTMERSFRSLLRHNPPHPFPKAATPKALPSHTSAGIRPPLCTCRSSPLHGPSVQPPCAAHLQSSRFWQPGCSR